MGGRKSTGEGDKPHKKKQKKKPPLSPKEIAIRKTGGPETYLYYSLCIQRGRQEGGVKLA